MITVHITGASLTEDKKVALCFIFNLFWNRYAWNGLCMVNASLGN